ncbi:MAG: hypothetical protein CM1200mP26_16130 [Acidimicrobiales bacterium]|nr:MAG: hypothetical protein CM1200mP26_16130 [Acidimicrobiales bacterium]
MDYAGPLFSELAFSLAVEQLLDIEVPSRATWIRMLMCELNRVSSHLLFQATNGMDLGAVSMMIYGWREREEVLRFFEKVTGLRMNHNYIRPGGVAADLPDGWREDVRRLLELIPPRLDEYDTLLTGQPIFRDRLQGVGVMTPAEALALSATGPILRSTGYAWDLRRDQPYLAYDEVDFDVIVGTHGDSFDRFAIRLNEIRESLRIVEQILDLIPNGDFRTQDKKVTPPPRARIDESMEALIHHFKIFTEGFHVPEGETFRRGRVSSRRTRVLPGVGWGTEAVSDAHPGTELCEPADPSPPDGGWPDRRWSGRRVIGGSDHGRGRSVSWFDAANERTAREILAWYPKPKSAVIPLLHLAQEQEGWVTPDPYDRDSRVDGHHGCRGTGHCQLLRDVQVPSGWEVRRQRVHQRVLSTAGWRGTAGSCRDDARGGGPGGTTDDGLFTVEDVECVAACTEAPCFTVNYRYFHRADADIFDEVVADIRAGRSPLERGAAGDGGELPEHGTLARVRQHVTDDRRVGAVPPEQVDGPPSWMPLSATATEVAS